MAIQYIGSIISGIASDTKPTPSANEKGVLFIETDTNKVYQWDTDSWNEVTSNAANLSGTTLNSNIVTSSLTTVGALNAGSITSGFTSIDVGSGGITTTGTVTAGNLNVTGTTTTVDSTNTTISDKIIELASGASTGGDAGIIIERGSTGNNAIMAWDEDNDRFHFGTTTDTGTSSSLTITTGTIETNIIGNVTGNTSGTSGSTTGNAATVTNGVYTTGNQTIGGTKTFSSTISGDISGNAAGTAATVTGAAQSAITSVGTLTALTVDNISINGTTIGHTSDTDLLTFASGNVTVAGQVLITSAAAPAIQYTGDQSAAMHKLTNGTDKALLGLRSDLGTRFYYYSYNTTPFEFRNADVYFNDNSIFDIGNTNSQWTSGELLVEAAGFSGAILRGYSTTATTTGYLSLGKSDHGTLGTHGAVDSGDYLGNINWTGSNGSAFVNGARMSGIATETWSGSARGSKLVFSTVDNTTTTLDERMTIDHNGNVGIGIAPSYKLHVNGATYLAGDAYLNHVGNKIEASASYNMISAEGYMRLQSKSSVYVAIDNDGSGTDAVFAVRANASGTNVFSVSETGLLRITGGSPGDGKVLTSDADGDATWEEAAGGGGSATLTVANGQTVTQGKGVAINTDGEAIPYSWGSHRSVSKQYAELNPFIQGIDGADSNWQTDSFCDQHNVIYDPNVNKYIVFYRYHSGRANVAGTGNGQQYSDTGNYPNVSSADGDKPINTLLGSGNEIDKEITWITCVGTMNNSTNVITWSGFQEVPIEVQPDTAYADNVRAAGAASDMGTIYYNQNSAAVGDYAVGAHVITYWTYPPGSGTAQGANQKRRWIMTAKFNTNTGKLDFSQSADLDGTGTNPNQYLGVFFAGFVGDAHCLLAKQPTSTSTGLQYYVQEFTTHAGVWSTPESPMANSTGSAVTVYSGFKSMPWCVWNPSNNKIGIYGYSPSESNSYMKQYTRSGLTLSATSDTTLHGIGISYMGVSGTQVLKHNSGTGAGDGVFFMVCGWYQGPNFAMGQITNESGSDTFDRPSYMYYIYPGNTSNNHYSNGGFSRANGFNMDRYTTDNSGDGALGMGQMFRYAGSRALQASAGDCFYSIGYWGGNDAAMYWSARKQVLRYDGWGGEGTTIQAQFGPSQNTQTGYGAVLHHSGDGAFAGLYKFAIGYGLYGTALCHWNPDAQCFVNFVEWMTPAVYKDNDNGQYTATSTKPYAAMNMNVDIIKPGNANLETAINWGTDPGPYIGLAKTTVTGNGSNTVDINIIGSVDTNQSGLAPGKNIYINHEGSAVPGFPFDSLIDINIGTAVTATSLIVANAVNSSGMSTSSSSSDLIIDD